MNSKILIPVLIFVLFFVVNGKSAMAAVPVSLTDKDFITNGSITSGFDGDPSTSFTWRSANASESYISVLITGKTEFILNSFSISAEPDMSVAFYDRKNNLISTLKIPARTGTGMVNLDVSSLSGKKISYFKMNNSNKEVSAKVYEMNLKGFRYSADLKNLTGSSSYDDVTLQFIVGANTDNVKIYEIDPNTKEEQLIKQLSSVKQQEYNATFKRKELSSHDLVLYPVTADGLRGEPSTVIVTTGERRVPPVVKDFSVLDVKEHSALLKWSFVEKGIGVKKIHLYDADKVLVQSFSNDVFTHKLIDLKSGANFKYFISLEDEKGNKSEYQSLSFKTLESKDIDPPAVPTIIRVSTGDMLLDLLWNPNLEKDVAGYDLYLDGLKVNKSLIKNTRYIVDNLQNGKEYKLELVAVDTSGNVSDRVAVTGSPKAGLVPKVKLSSINLKDVSDGISRWFGGLWLIIAFAVAIPLAFLIATRIKGLFIR